MILHVLRALFVLLMAAAGWFFIEHSPNLFGDYTWRAEAVTLSIGVLIVCIDILAPRRKLQIFSGAILGLLVGLLVAYALSFVVEMVVSQHFIATEATSGAASKLRGDEIDSLIKFINLLISIICCYVCISFILQTKDDFRFIVPYVEFSKQIKGARPILIDTSALIDGRLTDVSATGIVESQLIVPQFVIDELQALADSADKLKRGRGRRGLDMLNKLRDNKRADVILYNAASREEEGTGVDAKLLALALQLGARVLTTDFNLNKVGQLRGLTIINLNDLAHALKPVVLPGDRLTVRLQRAGEEAGQGVGYLEDGTMVVVEQGRDRVNEEVEFTVTKLLQTSAGRMVFGRLGGDGIAGKQQQPQMNTDAHR